MDIETVDQTPVSSTQEQQARKNSFIYNMKYINGPFISDYDLTAPKYLLDPDWEKFRLMDTSTNSYVINGKHNEHILLLGAKFKKAMIFIHSSCWGGIKSVVIYRTDTSRWDTIYCSNDVIDKFNNHFVVSVDRETKVRDIQESGTALLFNSDCEKICNGHLLKFRQRADRYLGQAKEIGYIILNTEQTDGIKEFITRLESELKDNGEPTLFLTTKGKLINLKALDETNENTKDTKHTVDVLLRTAFCKGTTASLLPSNKLRQFVVQLGDIVFQVK